MTLGGERNREVKIERKEEQKGLRKTERRKECRGDIKPIRDGRRRKKRREKY